MVKYAGSTWMQPKILAHSRAEEADGIAGVVVKCVNIGKNTKCEGSLLG